MPSEEEERASLLLRVRGLQRGLEEINSKIAATRAENKALVTENDGLAQYIDGLMVSVHEMGSKIAEEKQQQKNFFGIPLAGAPKPTQRKSMPASARPPMAPGGGAGGGDAPLSLAPMRMPSAPTLSAASAAPPPPPQLRAPPPPPPPPPR